MYFRQQIGKIGEDLACSYLENNNYYIIERNFLCRQGEIDIIAKDKTKKELVFIEVKARSNFNYGIPAEAVTKEKQRHLKYAIKYYLYKNHIENVAIRIDVVEVLIRKGDYKINHIKQIL